MVGSARGGGSTGSSAGGLPGGSAGRARAVVVHHRWTIIALAVVFTALAGLFGADVQSHLKSGGFEDPRSESSRAEALLEETFGSGAPDVLLVVTAADGNVDDPAVAAAAGDLVDWIATQSNVEQVVDYWRLGNPPPLRSDGGDRALVFVRLSGSEDDRIQAAGALRHATQEQVADGAIQVGVGGEFATYHELNEIIEEDLLTAEMIALPITLILLVIVFGSVAAALLPLAIGGISIVGTFLVLTVIAGMTDVSIFSLNFTTAMGLGLSIDYSLLVVSRFREELAGGHPVNDAVWRTVRTAGRTVLFSALTVASSLVALLVFTQYFLRSFAYAGIAVVGLAAVGAVVVLPAILAVVGHNVNRWQVRRPSPVADDQGRWYRLAMVVMRRPIPIATAGLLFLLVLGAPFLRVELGFPDERVLPPEATTREVGEILRLEFNAAEATPTVVVASGIGDPQARANDVGDYARELSRLPGVARVDALTGSYLGGTQVVGPTELSGRFAVSDATWLTVIPSVETLSADGEQLVRDVRAVDAPFEVLVGGPSAELLDGKAGMFDRLPLALLVIALITFIVLFLSFGSVLMPLKAIVLNLLSLSATFGALVWVFQDGRFESLLGFTATGTLVITMPVLMFITAFGLSMDYEVFLLSRVREEFDRTGDNTLSVARGLERTGRIVTAAAVLISVVFLSFALGRVSFITMFGLGMALAVLVDAFIVRTTLVPAFMRLAGRANWWAPAPLQRVYDRIGFREVVDLDLVAASAPDPNPRPASTPG